MHTVNAKELRLHLAYYIDRLRRGEEIRLIWRSSVIGTLVLVKSEAMPAVDTFVKLSDTGSMVKFRQYVYEDTAAVKALHVDALKAAGAYVEPDKSKPGLDADLENVRMHYMNMEGDFIVGELNGEIVAMGGFYMNLTSLGSDNSAELKRMRVKPELQDQGIGSKLLKILETKAYKLGYTEMILDVTDVPGQAAARKFYEKHGYTEFERQKATSFSLLYYKKDL